MQAELRGLWLNSQTFITSRNRWLRILYSKMNWASLCFWQTSVHIQVSGYGTQTVYDSRRAAVFSDTETSSVPVRAHASVHMHESVY